MRTALLLLALAGCACAHAGSSNPEAMAAMPPSTWRYVQQKGSLVVCEAQVGGSQGHGLAIGPNAELRGSEVWVNGSPIIRFVGSPTSNVTYAISDGVCIVTYR